MELNREQIIKALECCASDGCETCPNSRMPTLANCVIFTMGNALSLIKELTEENERLSKSNDKWQVVALRQEETMQMIAQEKQAYYNELVITRNENERLRVEEKQSQILIKTLHDKLDEGYAKFVDEEIADTVRKMHSEIKERCIKGGIYPAFVANTIDQIAKEMLEGI